MTKVSLAFWTSQLLSRKGRRLWKVMSERFQIHGGRNKCGISGEACRMEKWFFKPSKSVMKWCLFSLQPFGFTTALTLCPCFSSLRGLGCIPWKLVWTGAPPEHQAASSGHGQWSGHTSMAGHVPFSDSWFAGCSRDTVLLWWVTC